jgi:hypothetical protein
MCFPGHGGTVSVSRELANPTKQHSGYLPKECIVRTRLVVGPDQCVKIQYFLNVE